jgi:hypothetical protein
MARHLARKPAQNPIVRYEREFSQQVPRLAGDLTRFHAYAFASLRQCGSAYELGARYLRWLLPDTSGALAAADDLDAIGAASKTAMLRLARAVATKKTMDLKPLLAVAPLWDDAFQRLNRCVSPVGSEAA